MLKLLSTQNSKTLKGNSQNYLTGILYLSPSDLSGHNVCPMANQIVAGEQNVKKSSCSQVCLNLSGLSRMAADHLITIDELVNGRVNRQQSARLQKTKMFFDARNYFMSLLFCDIETLQRKAIKDGSKLAIRLNGTSDIDWSIIKFAGKNVFETFPDIQFYDYTKVPKMMLKAPKNYHLTYSLHDGAGSWKFAETMLNDGRTVAAVFPGWRKQPLPASYKGFAVVDGDLSDLRFKDRAGVIVGLRGKGYAYKSDNKFARQTALV